jgi:hypothetical protein
MYESFDAEDVRSSPIDPNKPNLKRYPLYQLVGSPYEVIMEPGDVLYIPSFWYHQVESSCRHLSIDMRFDIHDAKGMHAENRRRGTNPDTEHLARMAKSTESSCEIVKKWDKEAGISQIRRHVEPKIKNKKSIVLERPAQEPKKQKKIVTQQDDHEPFEEIQDVAPLQQDAEQPKDEQQEKLANALLRALAIDKKIQHKRK